MKKWMMVTGGAGFLGSNLCKALLKLGHNVLCVDNFSSSTGDNINNTYFVKACREGKFEFILTDITGPGFTENTLINDSEFEGIFNLACPASPPFYQSTPIQTTLTSVVGTSNCLVLAHKKKCPILLTSTSEVYGDPDIHPQPESYRGSVNCFGPRSCYDEGKRCAESLMYDFHKQLNVDIRIVRLFNTYGPGMVSNDGRVVTNFISQALSNSPITIYGDGNQTRSFAYVDDTIDGILHVWDSKHTSPVNIGNPGEFTMKELAEKVIKITNSKSEIVYQALPADDPKQRCPDISLAKSLGWGGPLIDLDTGLGYTVQYINSMR